MSNKLSVSFYISDYTKLILSLCYCLSQEVQLFLTTIIGIKEKNYSNLNQLTP